MNKLKKLFGIKSSKFHVFIIIVGCVLNVGLFFLMKYLDIPLYLDTVGTAYASFLLGPTAGIITSIVTMLVQFIVLKEVALLTALISLGVALSVGLTSRTRGYKNGLAVMGIAFINYLISTIISSLVPLLSKGQYHFDIYTNILYTALSEILTVQLRMSEVSAKIVSSLVASAAMRFIDTLAVLLLSFICYICTPRKQRYEMMGYDPEEHPRKVLFKRNSEDE